MAAIWVVAQHRQGKIHKMTLEALAAGQKLAAEIGAEVEALVLGDSDTAGVVEELRGCAVAGVRIAEAEALADYTPGGYVGVLAAALAAESPRLVLFPHTYQSVEYVPRLAQAAGVALVPEAVSFSLRDGRLVWRRPVLGGKLQAEVAVRGDGPALVSLQSGAFAADDVQRSDAPAPTRPLAGEPLPDRRVLGVEEAGEQEIDLSQAQIIVAVGRGIGKEENLPIIQELAAALGAEVGASRPVIDSGWLKRERQIGSSGQTVAPKLYIGVGISGAIQHLVGMKGSRVVVAINKDPGAPIFSLADYGIVGDLHEIVPAITAALREAG
jgi:electron transfer flavoprotein alpha subunit